MNRNYSVHSNNYGCLTKKNNMQTIMIITIITIIIIITFIIIMIITIITITITFTE